MQAECSNPIGIQKSIHGGLPGLRMESVANSLQQTMTPKRKIKIISLIFRLSLQSNGRNFLYRENFHSPHSISRHDSHRTEIYVNRRKTHIQIAPNASRSGKQRKNSVESFGKMATWEKMAIVDLEIGCRNAFSDTFRKTAAETS
jgi:hypothetical protein